MRTVEKLNKQDFELGLKQFIGTEQYWEHKLPEGVKSYSKTKPIRIEEFGPIKKWWKKRKESEVAWKIPIKTIKDRGWDLDIKNPNKEDDEVKYSSKELLKMLHDSFQNSDGLLIKLKEELL